MSILESISDSRIHEVEIGILDSYVKVADGAICCVLRPEEISCEIPFKKTEPYTAMQKLYSGKLLVKVNNQILLFICAEEHSVNELFRTLQAINLMDESGQFSTYSLKTAVVDKRYDIFYNTNITTIRSGGNSLIPICWKGKGKLRTQHVATNAVGTESSDLENTMRDVNELEEENKEIGVYDISVSYNGVVDFIVSGKRTAFNGNVAMARVLENVAACVAEEFNDKVKFDGLENFLLDEVAEFFVTGNKEDEEKEEEIPKVKKEAKVYSGNTVLERVLNEARDK